jgi:hypothetical protein
MNKGDRVVCIKLGKHIGCLTIDKHYTIQEIFYKVPFNKKGYGGFYRPKPTSDTQLEISLRNDLGGLSRCDFYLFETYEEWLAKFREQQMKTILDD